jgi:hypothetical protein
MQEHLVQNYWTVVVILTQHVGNPDLSLPLGLFLLHPPYVHDVIYPIVMLVLPVGCTLQCSLLNDSTQWNVVNGIVVCWDKQWQQGKPYFY